MINWRLIGFAWINVVIMSIIYVVHWHSLIAEFFLALTVAGGINTIFYEMGLFHWLFHKKKGETINIEMPKIER